MRRSMPRRRARGTDELIGTKMNGNFGKRGDGIVIFVGW